ncbi:MAG: YceI family protein [Actinobacteria bacterium]|nr:YceI family protein [Actinomycetota bacterium]
MSIQAERTTKTEIPAGKWVVDPVHSSMGFAVRHNTVTTFKGKVRDFDAKLSDGRLEGTAKVASLEVEDENLAGHLQTPDFFDAEQFPELRFVSSRIAREGNGVSVAGDLTIRGTTAPVELAGTISGPVEDGYGKERIGFDLETTVNRHDFGVSWNAELPGGGAMVDDEVTITANLALVQA